MSVTKIEDAIFLNLVSNDGYTKKVIPYIKEEYFSEEKEKLLFRVVNAYIDKFKISPTFNELQLQLNEYSEKAYREFAPDAITYIAALSTSTEKQNDGWLLDATQQWCKDRAIYNAVLSSIKIIKNEDKTNTKGAIPQLLSDALAVSFDPNVGHDYIDNSNDRYEFYHRIEERLPTDLKLFNTVTGGGFPNKTLTVFLAGTAVGKTLAMCHFASSFLKTGKNVLYITLEMSEERIAERIDANLLNISIADMKNIPKSIFDSKLSDLKTNKLGKLIIKEYPTASASCTHFRALLNELNLKRDFEPDVIFVDYMNIAASSRYKPGAANINSYTYIKAITEELRGIAVEYDVPLITGTQSNRGASGSTDLSLDDVSDSYGTTFTADFMFGLTTSDELEKLNQIAVKQLKNRYNDVTVNKKFVIGIDKQKMRLYDVESSAQTLSGGNNVQDQSASRFKSKDLSKFDCSSINFK